jgi:hypothetical protein
MRPVARTTGPDGALVLRSRRQGDALSLRTSDLPVVGAHGGTDSIARRFRDIVRRNRGARADWVIISQTCDLVKPPADRPNVQIAPVRRLSGQELGIASRFQQPRFAPVPQLGASAFADLDEITTRPKGLLLRAEQLGGLPGPTERRRFAGQIARHFGRPAYPDEFQESIVKLQKRILDRSDKKSPEGSAVTAIEEIRVLAKPSWDANEVDVVLFFIVPDAPLVGIDGKTVLDEDAWEEWIRAWQPLVSPRPPIRSCLLAPTTWEEMTALTYSRSDPLDVQYVSPT